MAGGKIDILVEPDVKGFGSKLETGLKGALGTAAKIGAGLGVAMGAGEAFRQVTSAGMEFQSTMNNLAAVSQATGAQLDQVAAHARALGSDTSLTATSASDAAAAMAELAKGGFTIDQSMQAAKGTLQLAAAAQIEAADAATIQSQALQSFSLGADHAARVSDILAGAANASSAEIQGISLGLAQSGTVASQFGISIDDTATALSMFANAGIQGSDAGTLLKTALIHLANPSKQAQKAMDELGLSVYDAHGKFVGLPSLFEQLANAQSKMTPEAYQSASATLFGTDAMRMAGIAAEQGREGFESLREAVTRQGQAAEVAAAQTEGLPGAMERLSNAAEEVALSIFDSISGPLVKAADVGTAALEKIGPALSSSIGLGIKAAGGLASALSPVISVAGGVASAFSGMAGPIAAASVAMVAFTKLDVAGKATAAADAVRRFGDHMQVQAKMAATAGVETGKFSQALAVVESRSPAIRGIATAARDSSAPMLELGRSTKATAQSMTGMGGASKAALGNLQLFAGYAKGTGAGAFATLKTGIGGVVNALGGPLTVGLGAATLIVASTIDAVQKMDRVLRESEAQPKRNAEAYRSMFEAIAQGADRVAVAEDAMAALNDSMQMMADSGPSRLQSMGIGIEKFDNQVSKFLQLGQLDQSEVDRVAKMEQWRDTSEAAKEAIEVLEKLGLTNRDLAVAATGSADAYTELRARLMEQGEGGEYAAEQLNELRRSFVMAEESFDRIGPAGASAAESIRKIREESGDAAENIESLARAFMEMQGIDITAEQAAANLTKELEKLKSETADFAGAQTDAEGAINLTEMSGVKLHEALLSLGSAMRDSVVSGQDANAVFEQSKAQLEQMRIATGMSEEQWAKLLERMQMTPEKLMTFAEVKTDDAKAELAQVQAAFAEFDGTKLEKNLIVKSDEARNALKQLGMDFQVINEQTGEVKITLADEEAKNALDWWVHVGMPNLQDSDTRVDILMDTTELEGSAQHAKQIIEALDIEEPSPAAKLIIDELLAGKDIAVGELELLTAESAVPKADLNKALLDAGIDTSKLQLDELAAKPTKPVIDVDNKPAKAGIDQVGFWLSGLTGRVWTATVNVIEGLKNAAVPRRAIGGAIPRLAAGGRNSGYRLPSTGPGTEIEDGFLGVNAMGIPLARLDGGEWVVNAGMSRKYARELQLINSGLFPKLPGFAAGGVVSGEELLAFFDGQRVNGQQASQSLNGAPYRYGGYNWGDCSSTQGHGALFSVGEPALNGRAMTTASAASVLPKIGFASGLGGEGTFSIGVFNGGQWGGHTSGTVWPWGSSPVAVEMGGGNNGGAIGGGAAPASHSQYTHHYHVPLAKSDGTLPGEDVAFTSTDGVVLTSGRSVSWGEAQELHDMAIRYLNLPRHATGGRHSGYRLPSTGPGTEVTDGFLAVNSGGVPIARLDADEWVINGRSSQLYNAELQAINAGTFPKLPGFAAGRDPLGVGKQWADFAKALPKATGDLRAASDKLQDAMTGEMKLPREVADAIGASTAKQLEAVLTPRNFGGEFLGRAQIVIDAEQGLIDTRQKIADEADNVVKVEEELAEARKDLAKAEKDAGEGAKKQRRKVADAEEALAKARAGGKAASIATAEKKLARAREDSAKALEKADDKEAKAIKRAQDKVEKTEEKLTKARKESSDAAAELVAAERTVVAARFQAAANLVQGVTEGLAAGVSHLGKFFDIMADMAELVEKHRQEVSKLQMQQQMHILETMKALQDLQVKEWDVAKARVMGAVSVAQAEAELQRVRDEQALLGKTSVEAMSGALDRFRLTGIFAVEQITESTLANAAAVRAAEWGVEQARAQAALDEAAAAHARQLAALNVTKATLQQSAAAEMLRLKTAQLTEQTAVFYGMQAPQARGAAQGFGGLGKVVGGLGKVGAGILGALAGFAVGGPVGALAGAGIALSGIKDTVQGSIDIHNNKKEMADAWSGMGTGDKAGVIIGTIGGGALAIGGGALASQFGPEMAVGGAQLADQFMDATIGSIGYNVESSIDAINRRAEGQQTLLALDVEAKLLELEAKRLQLETVWASKQDSLQAGVDFAGLQKQLAESSTKEEAQALAAAAEVAAQRRDQMLVFAERQAVESSAQVAQLTQLVSVTSRMAANAGTGARHITFELPPGESFTRDQTQSMVQQAVDQATRQQVDALAYFDSRI